MPRADADLSEVGRPLSPPRIPTIVEAIEAARAKSATEWEAARARVLARHGQCTATTSSGRRCGNIVGERIEVRRNGYRYVERRIKNLRPGTCWMHGEFDYTTTDENGDRRDPVRH